MKLDQGSRSQRGVGKKPSKSKSSIHLHAKEKVRLTPKRRGWIGLLLTLALLSLFLYFEFPFKALIDQNNSLRTVSAQSVKLSQENQAMSQEINLLHTSGEISHIARRDFGLIKPGESAYAILPSGSSTLSDSSVPPIPSHIVPGGSPSGEQDGALGTPLAPTPISANNALSGTQPSSSSNQSFLGRVIDRLEFWK